MPYDYDYEEEELSGMGASHRGGRSTPQARGLPGPNIKRLFKRARVNIPGKIETIWQPLYDYQILVAAGVANQSFFQVPIGQSGKTNADTNMELAGQLPKGQAFAITGVQVEILPGETISDAAITAFSDDVYSVLKGGSLELRIGSKNYVVQGNLMKFPPVNSLMGVAATGLAAQQIQYIQSTGQEFVVRDLLLESSQNFSIKLNELAALPSTADARIGVTLNGFLFRNAQ